MEKIVVNGGNRLHGSVRISGAKNAAVAIIPAVVLSDGVCRIENIPNIQDVNLIAEILYKMGAKVSRINKTTLEIDPRGIREPVAAYDLVRHMRASSYLMGALLGKFLRAEVALPGGCDFGVRPVDQHLKGFGILGASHSVEGGMIKIKADKLVGKKALIIHHQFTANAVRVRLKGCEAVCASWFRMIPSLKKENDIHIKEEQQLAELAKDGGFDVIIADSFFKRAMKDFKGQWIDLPHFAVSGRLNKDL